MQTHIRGYCERAATPAEPGTPIRFVASTEKVGRDGLVILSDSWQLDNFRANPIFLWHHDYFGGRGPIGKAAVSVEKNRLIADVTFDQGDPFAVDVDFNPAKHAVTVRDFLRHNFRFISESASVNQLQRHRHRQVMLTAFAFVNRSQSVGTIT